jgi:hypothetical protein
MKLVRFCLSLSAQQQQQLRAAAQDRGINVSALIRELVDRQLLEHYHISIYRTSAEKLQLVKLRRRKAQCP